MNRNEDKTLVIGVFYLTDFGKNIFNKRTAIIYIYQSVMTELNIPFDINFVSVSTP